MSLASGTQTIAASELRVVLNRLDELKVRAPIKK
jgi:hypothetical protein